MNPGTEPGSKSQSAATKKAPAKKAAGKKKPPAKKKPTPQKAAVRRKAPVSEESSIQAPPFDDEGEDLWGADWDDLGAFGDDIPGTGRDEDQPDATRQLANDGVEIFQNAAFELIAAARTALDAAEELVADPHMIGTAFDSLRDVAGEMVRVARPAGQRRTEPRGDDDFQSIRVEDD